jgi:hypothetical protein
MNVIVKVNGFSLHTGNVDRARNFLKEEASEAALRVFEETVSRERESRGVTASGTTIRLEVEITR